MTKVTRLHLDQQIELLRNEKDPDFNMSNWCGTTHCLYGGAALLAGQSPEIIAKGLPDGWDIGPDTAPLRKLFLSAYLSANLVVKFYDAIKDGKLNLSRADLSGADLSEADLSGADLSGADLSGANLSDADLSGADLREADLREADLSRAYLGGADLSGANLSDADLSWVNLSDADLSWAIGLPEQVT